MRKTSTFGNISVAFEEVAGQGVGRRLRPCDPVKEGPLRPAAHGLSLALNQWTQADLRSTTNVFVSDVTAVIPSLQRGPTVIVTLPKSARRADAASLSEINCS
ncbi:MAG: hypothetical protein ACKOE2_10545 [Actinomycetales bacterium]